SVRASRSASVSRNWARYFAASRLNWPLSPAVSPSGASWASFCASGGVSGASASCAASCSVMFRSFHFVDLGLRHKTQFVKRFFELILRPPLGPVALMQHRAGEDRRVFGGLGASR